MSGMNYLGHDNLISGANYLGLDNLISGVNYLGRAVGVRPYLGESARAYIYRGRGYRVQRACQPSRANLHSISLFV